MPRIAAAILLFVPMAVGATPIVVGGTSLEIPPPPGFAPVTQQMGALYEFQKHLVAPTNEEFVAFISANEIPEALKGHIPDLARRFTVQTVKTLVARPISSADFAEIKKAVKTQNDEILEKVKKAAPEAMEQINRGLTKDYNVDLALSISSMVPLPIHEESDRSLSFSMIINFNAKDASGKQTSVPVVCTATFVHIRGKVLFLYSYAEEGALQWTKETSKVWADTVVAANPSNAAASLQESMPRAASGIDWTRIGVKASLGALIGLVVGLFGWLKSRGAGSSTGK